MQYIRLYSLVSSRAFQSVDSKFSSAITDPCAPVVKPNETEVEHNIL